MLTSSVRRLVIARRNDVVISSRVRDGSENPLRSKEYSEQPDPKGHAQKDIKKTATLVRLLL